MTIICSVCSIPSLRKVTKTINRNKQPVSAMDCTNCGALIELEKKEGRDEQEKSKNKGKDNSK